MLYLCHSCYFLIFVSRSKRTHWTVHFHRPRRFGPTVSASPSTSLHRQDGRAQFKRYKSLKKRKKKPEENRKKATFQDSQSCSTQAKITNACFCNCLDPSSDPIAEDLPASCTDWRTLTVKGVSHAAPASRGSPLYSSLLHDSICIHHKHTHIYTVITVCGVASFWIGASESFVFVRWYKRKQEKKKQYVFFFLIDLMEGKRGVGGVNWYLIDCVFLRVRYARPGSGDTSQCVDELVLCVCVCVHLFVN